VSEQVPVDPSGLVGASGEEVLQLHAEQPVIETRVVVGETVRVSTVTHVREYVVEVPLTREVIEVEHVAIGRVVDSAPSIRYEGDVTILPVLEEVEVVVVERRLMLKEEIHVRRRRVSDINRDTISLRSQTAVVTRFVADVANSVSRNDAVPSDTEPSAEEV
jgi:stress response protein YsnF